MDMLSSNLIIIVLTCVVSYTAFNNSKLMADWILNPYKARRDNQYYRYLTYGLLHANGMHLLFNMLTLFFFGSFIEKFYGSELGVAGYPLFYLGGIICSVIPSASLNQKNPRYNTLGASGAVSAVLFAYILFDPWTSLLIFFIVPCPAIVFAFLYVAYSIWFDKKGGDNINHSAHLWGALYGVLVTLAIEPAVLGHFINQLANPVFAN